MELTREITDKIKRGIESGKIQSVKMASYYLSGDANSFTSLTVGPLEFNCSGTVDPQYDLMNEINACYWDKVKADSEVKAQEFLKSL